MLIRHCFVILSSSFFAARQPAVLRDGFNGACLLGEDIHRLGHFRLAFGVAFFVPSRVFCDYFQIGQDLKERCTVFCVSCHLICACEDRCRAPNSAASTVHWVRSGFNSEEIGLVAPLQTDLVQWWLAFIYSANIFDNIKCRCFRHSNTG